MIDLLPHRPPFRFVDAVDECNPGRDVVARWRITGDETWLAGHFPARPVVPGVLQIEALAQAAGILAIETLELAGTGKLVYFMAIEEAKFRAPVEPGVLLDLQAGFVQKRARVCKFWGKASVGGKVTCEVQFTAMIADAPGA